MSTPKRSRRRRSSTPEETLNAAPKTVASLLVQRKKLVDLEPHPKNPRKHPERGTDEYEVMKASLEHDYFDPIVWNKRNGMMVSGHFRRRVLIDMGYHEADVVVVDYDEKTHISRMLAANKNLGKPDKVRTKSLFQELFEGASNLNLAGFTTKEIDKMLGSVGVEESRPDYPITPMLGEKHDYVVIYTGNETDRAFLHSLLDIRQEKSYKSTSVGLGRVVPFKRAMQSLVRNKASINAQVVERAAD